MNAVPFLGWRVVAAAFVLAMFGWGLGFYGPPVYLQTVREARGWSVSLVSAAVTTHYLFGALVIANLPRIYARFGIPAVTKAGSLALGLGVGGWAVAEAPWQLFAATLLSGGGWVTLGAAAVNAIVSPWFVRRRPAALAAAYNGASIGGVVFSPLWVAAIAAFGFPAAAAGIGLVMLVTMWLLADLYFAKTPAQMGQVPDGDAPGAATTSIASPKAKPLPGGALWRDWGFRTLALGMALSLFAQIGLLAHLYSLLVPALGSQAAGLALGGATLAAIAGRTLVGWLMPPGADRRLVASLSFAVQMTGGAAFLLAGGSHIPLLLTGVILFGAGIGNTTSMPPLIAQGEFVKEDVPRVVALILAMAQTFYAFAPASFGLLRDLIALPTTPQLYIAAMAIQALAIAAFLLGRRR